MPIHQLSVEAAFNQLDPREKLYAHHMAKAAWSGTRILHRQVSPESSGIFDFIMRLYKACKTSYRGDWDALANACKVSRADVNAFLEYAATFLSNMGNYYVWSITVYWVLRAAEQVHRVSGTRSSGH